MFIDGNGKLFAFALRNAHWRNFLGQSYTFCGYVNFNFQPQLGVTRQHYLRVCFRQVCPDRDNCLITIILDGENAWEYYPENGYHFLQQFYNKMTEHPSLKLTTYQQFLTEKSPQPAREDALVAGSWVYGTFSTWIGDPDKNRGWEMLAEAKQAFDEQLSRGALAPELIVAAEKQLAICEGSDWFWWLGDYNPAATVSQFDQLFRMHLANLYLLLNV